MTAVRESVARKKSETVFLVTKASDPQSKPFRGIIGHSPAMKDVFNIVKKVSIRDTNVLLTGESGIGKSMIAKHISWLLRSK